MRGSSLRPLLQVAVVVPESGDGGALYVGSIPEHESALRKRNIGAVINLSGFDLAFDVPIDIWVYDLCQPFEDGYPLDAHRIDDMLEFIHEHRRYGTGVLVFCRHGHSASVFIAACYLKQVLGRHTTEVWDWLRVTRPSMQVHERYKAIWDIRYGLDA
jgi:hypothetical protein